MKRVLLIAFTLAYLGTFFISTSNSASAETEAPCPRQYYSDQNIYVYNTCGTACENSVSLGGTTNKEKIWGWLIAKGMSPMGAAGIMGNMNNESGFNPFRFQTSATNEEIFKYDGNLSGYNGNAWGLVQWDGPRRVSGPDNTGTNGILDKIRIDHSDWVKYIDRKYGDTAESYTVAETEEAGITDKFINFSMNFLYTEATPGGNRSTVWADVNSASSVSDAAVIFHQDFEGSADGPEKIASRVSAGQAIYDSLNGAAGAGGASSSSSNCGTKVSETAFTYYSQLDPKWLNSKIRASLPDGQGGSFAADGCGPTADAMVISSLTGDASVTPVTIAAYADTKGYIGGSGANSDTNLTYGLTSNSQLSLDLATQYKLSRSDLGTDISKIVEYVRAGGMVVMSGRSGESNDNKKTIDGPFSSGGHYVVVKAVTADGKLVIANPYSVPDGTSYTPQAGHPAPWAAEQTFDASHFDSLTVTGAYGFKKA